MEFHKLGAIVGNTNLYNEVICNKMIKSKIYPRTVTVFFGGDVQDYPEVMSSHRDHGRYLKWNLLNIVTLLSMKFTSSVICVVKPKRMEFKTFSCYDNFVISNNLGTPTYSEMNGALSHLKNLVANTLKKLSAVESDSCANHQTCDDEIGEGDDAYDTVNLIGFSKGCAVLNQLITEVHTLSQNSCSENEEVMKFWRKVRSIYWLDGGHSGGKNTWITRPSIVENLSKFPNLSLQVHVTPYQVRDETRPWIGKECKTFVDILRRARADVHYKLHFEDEIGSLENHFRILEEFK